MRKKTTILIAAIAMLIAGNGTMWGQAYEQGYVSGKGRVDLRRGDANTPGSVGYINNKTNVNNEFGAGESSSIVSGDITWPNGNTMHNPPAAIQLGSEYSQNIVINTYNAGGYVSGVINFQLIGVVNGQDRTVHPNRVTAGGIINYTPEISPGDIYSQWAYPGCATIDWGNNHIGCGLVRGVSNTALSSTPSISHGNLDMGSAQGVYAAGATTTKQVQDSYQTHIVDIYLVNHVYSGTGGNKAGHWRTLASSGTLPYTSTLTPADSLDDGVKLLQTGGDKGITPTASIGNAPVNGAGLTPYKRPTTVSVSGENTFEQITFKDIKWWFRHHTVQETSPNHWCEVGTLSGDIKPQIATSCGCHSGIKWSSTSISGKWNFGNEEGSTKLDAAVQLLKGARVCVTGNVQDATGHIATTETAGGETNAVIVVPDTARFTLRTAGNFKSNMVHSKDSLDTRNAIYTQADFPQAANDDIWLWSDATKTDAQTFGQTLVSYPSIQVPFHNQATYKTVTTTKAPYISTYGSLFGVKGDYQFEGLMAKIHTDTTSSYDSSNKGVIEVGQKTAGKENFHIYGNGMLKNFEGCNATTNFPMEFGDGGHGGTPVFTINTNDTLYIVNFGNNGTNACAANLEFYTTSVDAINTAFTGTGAGALQIQALNHVRFNADGTWDATSKGNNIYVLSDAGNISSQKLTINSDNSGTEPGHGLINFLTAGRTDIQTACDLSSRNSGNGNIYFNDEVTITRANANSTQTNIIAKNNIRTAKFTSTNANIDTTNIISQNGDIWLGYSTLSSALTGDNNEFTYNGTGDTGELNIMAGFGDTKTPMGSAQGMEGGNIYFTRLTADMTLDKAHNTTIAIPYSSEYICGVTAGEILHSRKNSMQAYEHSGIIGGVGRCGTDLAWNNYAGQLENPGSSPVATQTSLTYKANNGNLTVDAGQRGNIIMNQGTELDFQGNTGNGFFRTRFGDIDLRNKTNVQNLKGNLVLLAQTNNLSDLSKVGFCGCAEERNNVYVQDLQVTMHAGGSVFIGADNNIKLNYGGLQNKGTKHDPFLSTDYNPANPGEKIGTTYPCNNGDYHCDMVDGVNMARELILDFSRLGSGAPATSGGFAAVASDYIDVYKKMEYMGGDGSGINMATGTNTFHGEQVSGYGLYMKTQGNKNNWNTNIFREYPKCPTTCGGSCETGDYLHMVSRMTFHSDARIHANNQKVYLGSPVIESFGTLELDSKTQEGSKTEIVLQADSLILHDSLVVHGNKVKYRSWSGLNQDKPIFKFGYSRKTPPVREYKYKDIVCAPCYEYIPGSKDPLHMLDTITVKFKAGETNLERMNTTVFDHTVLTFLTDSFDHKLGAPILNAKIYVDTLKVRNQVAMYADKEHTRDAHFELISEEQMFTKDYAGVYMKHYHMEPIGACERNYSELWLAYDDPALDVITTSTFGGFGYQHSDVHVENMANINAGFTSLRLRGQCYEQSCGTLTMENLRLDGGAQLHFSVGTTKGINGEYSDAISVNKLTTYGTVDVNIEIRPCERMEARCYPIIYYKSQTPGSLNSLRLATKSLKIDGVDTPLALDFSTPGIVYLCLGSIVPPVLDRAVTIPSVAGVTTTPSAGIKYTPSGTNFFFNAKYSTSKPMVVRTNRTINGETEVLEGKLNANGEYEYVIPYVRQNIVLSIGPDFVVANTSIDGTAVWSHGETIYIRVEREDIASIYSVAGQLVKRIELPEGDTSIPMQRGAYVVTLKDGSVHKVIVK